MCFACFHLTVHSYKVEGAFTAVYKSETVMNNLSPSWKPFTVDAQVLCGGDPDTPVLIEVPSKSSPASFTDCSSCRPVRLWIGKSPASISSLGALFCP